MTVAQAVYNSCVRPVTAALSNLFGFNPSVVFDFNSKQLDSRITFSRASTATYFDSNGNIATAAINEPRFDYDPVTKTINGLLIEESRVNLLLNSDSLSTQNVTTTANGRVLSFYGTGTVVISGAHSATVVGTGAFPTRTVYAFTPTAGTLTLTVTGSVLYANLESGAANAAVTFPTSYIPTTSSQVTRAQDSAHVTGTNFSSWYRQDEGTIFIEGISTRSAATGVQTRLLGQISDSSTSNAIIFGRPTTANNFKVQYVYGGVSANGTNGQSISGIQSNVKAAIALKSGDFAFSVNGLTATTSSGVGSATMNRLSIGHNYNNTQTNYLCGHIKRIAFYRKRLTNAQLQQITK